MFRRLLSVLGVWSACSVVSAQAPPAPDAKDAKDATALAIEQILQRVTGGAVAVAGADEDQPFPDFAKVTKGMKSDKGLFTLWYYPPEARDKDSEKLLVQIPSSLLGEHMMLSTSFAGGGFFTGFPVAETVIKWELHNRQLLIIEPETGYVLDGGKEVSDVVRRTYPDRIRAAIPLVTKSPEGDPVVDLGPLLKSEFADIGWAAADSPFMGMFGGVRISEALSRWTKRKTFELNTELQVELAVMRNSPPGSHDKKLVHYSFWRLPKTDYQPRVADSRLGYFLTTNVDWSKPVTVRELFNRYVNRWHLVKRDPALTVSEPRQPIIFYIEKTVPVRWRRAVRDGILEWNKAFEKIGFANAIEVRQQTDDNEWKDLDPEDMRYSFIRWIVTGAGFAMGPSRANPFTGQIYDADIIFDDSMVRYFEQEANRLLPQTALTRKTSDPALAQFFEQFPQFKPPVRPWESAQLGEPADAQFLLGLARRRAEQSGRVCCTYAHGMRHQLQLAHALLADQKPEVTEKVLQQAIKEVVMHEVGHTLGLRHNFAASAVYTLEEIETRRAAGDALAGSVMDYNPVYFAPDMALDRQFITQTIGPYDYWVIEYGYRPFDGSYSAADPKADKPKDGDKEEEKPDGDDATPAAEEAEAVASSIRVESSGAAINLDDIPAEIKAQLPPEARQMIESGAAKAMLEQMKAGGGAARSFKRGASGGPAFTGAPAGESEMLRQIASRSTEPELAYATDEDTMFISPDPRSNRFDMGANPTDWARLRLKLVDQRLKTILEWGVKDKESWEYLRPAFITLTFERLTVLDYVGRYVGGMYFSRAHRGDPNAPAPFRVVEAAKQREALAFIEEHLFRDSALQFDPNVLNHVAPPRWWHQGMSIDFVMDVQIRELIALMQWWNLFDRFYPNTLRRIHDSELKSTEPDRLTAAEYLQTLQRMCWGELTAERPPGARWSDAEPFISATRRSLQREYLGIVEPLLRMQPGVLLSPDLHAMLTHTMRILAEQMTPLAADPKVDFASRAHVAACKSRIERIISAELRETQPMFGGGGFLMQEGAAQPPARR